MFFALTAAVVVSRQNRQDKIILPPPLQYIAATFIRYFTVYFKQKLSFKII